MDIKEIEQAVYNINNVLYELLPEMVGDGYYELTSTFNGWTTIVMWLGTSLWNDEDDDRPYIDEENGERVDLEQHLKQKVLHHVRNISKIMF